MACPRAPLTVSCRCGVGVEPSLGWDAAEFLGVPNIRNSTSTTSSPQETRLRRRHLFAQADQSRMPYSLITHILIVKLLDQLLTVSSLTCGFKRSPPVYDPNSPIPAAPQSNDSFTVTPDDPNSHGEDTYQSYVS